MSKIFTLGERLALPKYSSFRTIYPVLRDGVLFCFLGMRNGFGRPWEVYPLKVHSPNFSNPNIDGFAPDGGRAFRSYFKDKDDSLEALRTGHIAGHTQLKDANELRAATDAKHAADAEQFSAMLGRLRNASAITCKRRDALKELYATMPTGTAHYEALGVAIAHFESEVASHVRAIETMERSLAEHVAGG